VDVDKSTDQLNAELTEMRRRIAELEAAVAECKRAEQLLLALNQAAVAMERVLTPEGIFAAVGEELKRLNLSCAVFLMDESQTRLSPRYLSHGASAIRAAERLTGLKVESFSIPIEQVDLYEQVIQGKRTVFMADTQERARQALPGPVKRFAAQIARILNLSRSIGAPLIAEDRVIGVLSVQSDSLTENDVTAITAFAHQVAAAWRKAQLLQQAQGEIAEGVRIEAIRTQAEEALRESQQMLRLIMDHIPQAIFWKDLDLVYLGCNREFAADAGLDSPDDIIGKSDYDMPWVAEAERYRADDRQVIETGEARLNYEEPQTMPSGEQTWLRTSKVPLRDADGEVVSVLGMYEDITERVRTERLLQALNDVALSMGQALTPEDVFAAVAEKFDEIGFLCAVFHTDASRTRISPAYASHGFEAAERLLGSRRDDLAIPVEAVDVLGKVVWERETVFLGDACDATRQLLREPAKRLAGQTVRTLSVAKAVGAPLIADDQVIGVLLVRSDDLRQEDVAAITAFAHQMAAAWRKAQLMQDLQSTLVDRQLAEAERERLLAQVQEQVQRVKQIMDTVPAGMLLLDAEHRVVLANPVAEQSLAVLAGARVGDTLIHLGDHPLAALLNSPPEGLWHEVATDGRVFEVIARSLETGPGPGGWVLVVRDVTQERFIQRHAQQRERLATVGQLAAGIAHDFNNIMAAIALYAQMMARTPGLSKQNRERLATIDQQAKYATKLIQQILDFGRRAVIERKPLNLLLLVKEHVKLLERTLPENIAIDLSYGPDEYTVKADPTRIQQVMMNLALNARDALPDGGELHIGLERIQITGCEDAPLPGVDAGEWVQVTLSDTGTGIKAEVLPHIFDPFFTTKEPGQGSGLGLAQVYGIVKQHGGEIGVDSEPSRGTAFTIYLPALPSHPAEVPGAAMTDLAQGQGETILVVEDNPAARAALVESLRLLNYQVLEAVEGREALAVLEERGSEVALVLSDVVMPGMGGIALLRSLRQRGLETRVLLLTGHPLERQLDSLQTQGMVGWMLKPPSLEQLAEVIAQALEDT